MRTRLCMAPRFVDAFGSPLSVDQCRTGTKCCVCVFTIDAVFADVFFRFATLTVDCDPVAIFDASARRRVAWLAVRRD